MDWRCGSSSIALLYNCKVPSSNPSSSKKKKKSTKGCIPKHHIHQPTTTLPLTPSSLSIPLAYVVPLFTGLPVLSADFIMIDEDLLFLHHYSLFLVSSLLYIVKLSHGLL
jgi:hypothetical protein